MASVDSGVETENDSDDSLATHDSQSNDLSPPVNKVNDAAGPSLQQEPAGAAGGWEPMEEPEPIPVVSEEKTSNLKQPIIDFDMAFVKRLELDKVLLGIDPPAGLSFVNLLPKEHPGHAGYEVTQVGHEKETQTCFKMQTRKRDRRYFALPTSLLKERTLRIAVSTNNVEGVRRCLDLGVDPNSCDHDGRSPLHLAACKGYPDILDLLLKRGADPNRRDGMGNTPLHLAACTSHVEVVTKLLKAGTNVQTNDQYGRNPLQLAESRLRLLQRNAASNPDATKVKLEVQSIIEMMVAYLNGVQASESDAEFLSSFKTRLTLSQTPQEVDHEVRGLLASLQGLAIDKPAS